MLLSILIPSVPERADKLKDLLEKLKPQIKAWPGQAEALVLIDFRTMSLGEKRNRMMQIAAGRYVIHLDDDDRLVDGALDVIVPILQEEAFKEDPVDVIAYDQESHLDGADPFIVRTSIDFENEGARLVDKKWQDIKRKPWHWCCWRTELARQGSFVGRIDEDWQWLKQVLPLVKRQRKLDQVLHQYWFHGSQSLCQAEPLP